MATPDWNWQRRAACRGEDVSLFFGLDGERGEVKDQRERAAKAICAQCPVRNPCLLYALEQPERSGTWGGLNEDERKAERRRRMRHGIPMTQAPAVAAFKRCRCCRKTKPVAQFGPRPKNPDGLSNWCWPCTEKARKPTWARTETSEVA